MLLPAIAAFAARAAEKRLSIPENYVFDSSTKRAELQAQARPLNWKALLSARASIFYIGESHYNGSIRNELISRMPDFKKAGVTGLGVEVPYLLQPVLNRYLQKRDDAATRALKAGLEQERIIAHEGMFRLIEAAAREKIEVLAIDQSYAGGRANFYVEVQDVWMAGMLAGKLDSDPSAKLLVLLGSGHLHAKTQSRWLEDHKWRSRRYIFLTAGLENPFSFRPDFSCVSDAEEYEYFTALKGSFLWDQRLFFPRSSFDGYIILPETLTEIPLPRDRWPADPAQLCLSASR